MKPTLRFNLPHARVAGLMAMALSLLALHPVHAQKNWSGAGSDQNWSTDDNWSPAGVPVATAVRFFDTGAVGSAGSVNNVVDTAFSITSLHYGNTNGFHTTQIDSGQTLTASGGLTVGTETDNGNAQTVTTTALGGGGLNVSAGNLIVRQCANASGGGNRATLNLSGLDTFTASVGNVQIGVQISSSTTRGAGTLRLAGTNQITASVGLTMGDNGGNGGGVSFLFLGQTNTLFTDAIRVGRQKSTAALLFDTGLDSPVAVFRAANGIDRVATWNIGDHTGQNSSGTACRGTNNFSGGTVNALVGTLMLGKGQGTSGAASAGVLIMEDGLIDVNTLQVGVQAASGASSGGIGQVTLGSASGSLVVNTLLELGKTVGGSGTGNTVGSITVNGGTLRAASIVCGAGSGANTLTLNGGTLIVTNASATVVASSTTRLNTLNITNASLWLSLNGGTATTPKIYVGTLNLPASATPATTIHVDSIANVTTPTTFSIINSTARNGNAGSFVVGDYPEGYTVTVTSTGTEIQLQVAPPVAGQTLVWDGAVTGDWDTSTANWQGSLTYNQSDDAVIFDDTLSGTSTVNLTTALTPFSLTVSNNETSYTFTGPGKLSGTIGLIKEGAGTLTFANDVANDFSGSIALNAGALAFDQSVDLTVANAISGAGALVKTNANTLTLSGASSSYTGNILVRGGFLRPANNNALGATNTGGTVTITNGATLDVGANTTVNTASFGAKQFYIAGTGVGGNGAIVNNASTNQLNAFQKITLTDDAAVGGQNRWDLRGGTPVLDLAGYTLTKTGANQITVVAGTITDGDIEINQGLLSVETTSSFTGSGTITVNAGGTLGHFRNTGGLFNRPVTLNGGAITNLSGSNAFVGTNSADITLAADSTLGGSSAATYPLVFTGIISGSGRLTKTGAGPVVLTNVNTYDGDTVVATGALSLSGSGSIADSPVITVAAGATLDAAARTDGTLTLGAGQTLEGDGTVNGAVVVNGTVAPGASIGTLAFGGALTLNSGAVMDVELGDGPTADEASAGGAVIYGGTLKLTWTGSTLTTGTVDLFDGSSFAGAFSSIQLVNWPDPALRVNTNNLTSDGSIAVTANAAPVAQNLTLGVAQGESVSLPVIGGKFAPADADGDSMTITGVTAASNGTSGFTANSVTYTADGTAGTHSFDYTVMDAFGATDTKTVTVVVYSPEGFNKLAGPTPVGGGLYQLDYLGVPGEDYALDESPELVPPYAWTPVLTNTAAGNGTLGFTVPLSHPSGSFRTRHVP